MNIFSFSGRLAAAPNLQRHGDTTVCRFRLLRNEYAGKDKQSNANMERTVGINFTAFGRKAESISEHCREGDQLIVAARVEDNSFEKDGVTHYSYNFIIDEFEFGAPGALKRQQLEQQRRTEPNGSY
ncbi:single-stranded DNA-binding protein [Paracidovorax wautersii]|uniref:Single-stranded DNA-binding protein n=1 Tax=Paracidovorax wautersii TaxID=1177982 RepID=A0A1I2HQ43_9BURK|nr:single-stranded DNA-binding protein [Paracidovorax wautersii]SFF31678.1 single-strand DNA-binding protein [Paracidovorax wautersii]